MESANLSDGAQPGEILSGEHAEELFGNDQAETNMVKLVDGKLVPMGKPHADVSDDMPNTGFGSDEERALTGDDKKKYETSEAALRAGTMFTPEVMPDNPIAVADITGNPDAGSTVNTGLPSEGEGNDRTDAGDDATKTHAFGTGQMASGSYISQTNVPMYGRDVRADMIPPTPGTPDPMQPTPGIPETPPYNPIPGPEIPELPGTPSPGQPEITEPDQPERSHEVNAATLQHTDVTFTAGTSGAVNYEHKEEGSAIPGNQYEGMTAGTDDEGRSNTGTEDLPNTGDSAHPYDVSTQDADEYQPGEHPEEASETRQMPREQMDESSIRAEEMISGTDRSDQKSTDGLDRNYNDPEAARELAT